MCSRASFGPSSLGEESAKNHIMGLGGENLLLLGLIVPSLKAQKHGWKLQGAKHQFNLESQFVFCITIFRLRGIIEELTFPI